MICPNCGTEAAEGIKICPVCGNEIPDSPLFQETTMLWIEETQMLKINDEEPEPEKKSSSKTVYLIIVAVILAVILFLLFKPK